MFALAGAVKGVIGLGLPTVSLALLAVALDLPTAMALLVVPSFVTNLWQALQGSALAQLLRRLWPFLIAASSSVGVGALALRRVDDRLLTALLGATLVVYAFAQLAGWRPTLAAERERPLGVVAGLVNGLLTGLTGSFVVPGVMYLQALGLERDALVQAMGVLFTLSTLALAVALAGSALLDGTLLTTSAVALVPALAGMALGKRLRDVLDEATFRRVFAWALLALGVYALVTNAAAV